MALERKKLREIPGDAVMLSEEDALKYHHKILGRWKIKSDVFAYKYGAVFLSAATILGGAYVNNHFRTKLKLFAYGRISSYLPICGVPGALAFLLHHELVLKDLVLLKEKHCPICIEMRASAIQSLFGLVVPLVVAPVTSLGLAHRYCTYNVPQLTTEPGKVLKLMGNFIQPVKNILFGIFVGQALLATVVTYFEAKSIYTVDSKLAELEKNLENAGKI